MLLQVNVTVSGAGIFYFVMFDSCLPLNTSLFWIFYRRLVFTKKTVYTVFYLSSKSQGRGLGPPSPSITIFQVSHLLQLCLALTFP